MCVQVNPADDLVRTTQEAERRLCHTVPVVVEKEHLAKISLSPPMISKDRPFAGKQGIFNVLHLVFSIISRSVLVQRQNKVNKIL